MNTFKTNTNTINQDNKESLRLLNGCEVSSLKYESIVYVEGSKVFRYGKHIDTLNTNEKIKELWGEFIYDEMGIRI